MIRAVGHPARIKILSKILSGQGNVTDICRALSISQAVASHHLGVLKEAGIVTGNRKGVEVFYSIAVPFIRSLLTTLDDGPEGNPPGAGSEVLPEVKAPLPALPPPGEETMGL